MAKIVHHIVSTRHIAVDPTSDAQTQQGRGESSCCPACQNGSPQQSPCLYAGGIAETSSFHGTSFSQLRLPRRPDGPWRVVQATQEMCVPPHASHMPERLRLCWRRLAWPNPRNARDTKVESTANCAPPNSGKPSAQSPVGVGRVGWNCKVHVPDELVSGKLLLPRSQQRSPACPTHLPWNCPVVAKKNPWTAKRHRRDREGDGDANDAKGAPERVQNRPSSRNWWAPKTRPCPRGLRFVNATTFSLALSL